MQAVQPPSRLAHAIWPQKITFDWPSVTLIIAGMLLCFAGRVSALLPYVKKLKVGEAEIELQEKLGDLRACNKTSTGTRRE